MEAFSEMHIYRFLSAKKEYCEKQFDKIFDEKALYLSTYSQKNDPFEGLPRIIPSNDPQAEFESLKKDLLRLLIEVDSATHRLGWGYSRELGDLFEKGKYRLAPNGHIDISGFRGKMRSVSFFRRNDNPLYWAYYSGLDGFCIKFKVDVSPFGGKFSIERPKPIDYVSDRPVLSEIELEVAAVAMEIFDNPTIDFSDHMLNMSILAADLSDRFTSIFDRLLLKKSKAWENEQEYRIYDFCSNSDYRPTPQLTPVDMIFGPNSSQDDIDSLREKFGDKINFKQVGISKDTYDLEFFEI